MKQIRLSIVEHVSNNHILHNHINTIYEKNSDACFDKFININNNSTISKIL